MKSTLNRRKHNAEQFACRMNGNTRVMQLSSMEVIGATVVFCSVHADVLDVVADAAETFPQVQDVVRSRSNNALRVRF